LHIVFFYICRPDIINATYWSFFFVSAVVIRHPC
jgi:hypothetical protein